MTRTKMFALTAAALGASLALAACGSGGGIDGASGSGGDGDTCKADTVWRLAFNQTEEHPEYTAAKQLGEDLCNATDGRYSIEVYPNEVLGSQDDVVNNVSEGSVEMMWIGGPVMESFNPDFIVFNLPYMFDSQKAQAAVLGDEDAVGDLYHSIEDSKHITVLGGAYAGVRNVYDSKKAIVEPADLKGLKLRVQQSDSQVKMIELMGAIAAPMGQGEVYTALQSGVLDGAENNETVYDALKHDEVAKYYSYTRHLMIPDYLLMNTDALNKMSDEDQKAFLDLIPGMIEDANTGFIKYAEESKKDAESKGAKFNDNVDIDAFRKRVQPLVKEAINNPVREHLADAIKKANEENPGD